MKRSTFLTCFLSLAVLTSTASAGVTDIGSSNFQKSLQMNSFAKSQYNMMLQQREWILKGVASGELDSKNCYFFGNAFNEDRVSLTQNLIAVSIARNQNPENALALGQQINQQLPALNVARLCGQK